METYFVTTICYDEETKKIKDCRTIAMYQNLKAAREVIEKQICDPFEGHYYKYAVIIAIEDGVYPDQTEVEWYEKYLEFGEIERIERPRELKNFRPYIFG